MNAVLKTATGEVVEFDREAAVAEVDRILSDWMNHMFAPLLMTESEVFAGLDNKTVEYLRARLETHPGLWLTLVRAAQYRRARPTSSRRPASERLVYFVMAARSGLIKIGSAVDPDARIRTLQTGSPEPLILVGVTLGGEAKERNLHRRFAADRSHGEWFHPSEELLAHIEAAR